ncbi:MAG: ABC transporter ATP-binding protein [Bdellovibrionales bacterium]
MIRAENLSRVFETRQGPLPILKDLSFEIKKGEIVAITGHSGSGKSTLLSILAGLDEPQKGEVFYDGQSLKSKSAEEAQKFRAKNISLIFQNHYLVPHLTAIENVLLPLQILGIENHEKNAIELLEQVGLKERLNHFPNELSGGESQRVAIARGLVVNPMLLLADEPTGSLDSETGDKVMKLYFDLVRKNNLTSVIVTHNQDLAKLCDRELKLSQGKILS